MTGILILICGIIIMLAEVSLLFIGTPIIIVVALLTLTGFTEYCVAREVWQEFH